MPKDDGQIALIIGEPHKRRGPAENDASWSIPGIISCTLAVLLGVTGYAVAKLADPASVGSKPYVLFWTSMAFGLGIGVGLAMAGLARARTSKLSPAIGLLLHLALFAMMIWPVAAGRSNPVRRPARVIDLRPPGR